MPTVLSSWACVVIVKSLVSVAASAWRVRSAPVIASVVDVIASGEATLTATDRTVSDPVKYLVTVPMGTRIWSSWLVKPVPPLAWRMPTTVYGRPPIVIVVPTPVVAMPRSSAVVDPRTATRRPWATSTAVSPEPCQSW